MLDTTSNITRVDKENRMTDAVKDHVQRILQAQLARKTALLDRVAEHEKKGYRIVNGGQVGSDEWEITDWRTGEMLAQGSDRTEGYDAATDRLDPDNKWFHIDGIRSNEDTSYVEATDLPESLAEALEDWIEKLDTTDEDIAAVLGWPVEKVTEYRTA